MYFDPNHPNAAGEPLGDQNGLGSTPSNFAALVQQVASWHAFPDRDRVISHIGTLARVATTALLRQRDPGALAAPSDVILERIPCDPEWLNRYLFTCHPYSAARIGARSFQNALSSLRKALRCAGLIDPAPELPDSATAWREAIAALQASNPKQELALRQFSAWCHERGIEPSAVTSETLDTYEQHVTRRALRGGISRTITAVAAAMRKVQANSSRGVVVPLRNPRAKVAYTLPWDAYSASLQAEVQAFRERFVLRPGNGPFRGEGAPRSQRPATIEARIFSLRQAAAALVLGGRDPATITSLRDLVEVSAFKQILMHYWRHAIELKVRRGFYPSVDAAPVEAGITDQTGAIAGTLMILARHHLKLPEPELQALAQMAADVTPRRQAKIRPKNLALLRQLDGAKARADLLHLAATLLKRARDTTQKPLARARLARTAVSIGVLLNSPIRIANLCALKLGTHLLHDGSRRARLNRLVLAEHETKNGQGYEAFIDPELAEQIAEFLAVHHAALAPGGSDYLFPAANGAAGHLSDGALRDGLQAAIEAEVGIRMTPHLFRHFLCRITLEEDPNALEDMRTMLGDKSLVTVLANYASIETQEASRRHQERLRRAKSALGRRSRPPKK